MDPFALYISQLHRAAIDKIFVSNNDDTTILWTAMIITISVALFIYYN